VSATEGAQQVIERGLRDGLDLHHFKRVEPLLPRVKRVLGMLKGLMPKTLLDVGSGRGAFLWPLLDCLPELETIAVDTNLHRLNAIQMVYKGGISRLIPLAMDVTQLALRNRAVEVVTILEVLEHLQDPERAVHEVVRTAQRFIIASVPSKADDNPQHINKFSAADLEQLFSASGAKKIDFSYVLNHMLILVTV
jgi:ubiquinone/menaquinone biosynthesis C-methylase UbiE